MITNADDLFEFSINHLIQGAAKSTHDFHTCCVSSICSSGFPKNRTVVFRKFSEQLDTIYIHSDSRSEKNKDFFLNPNAALLFYSKKLKLQVRFNATASIFQHDQESKNAFYGSSLCAKRGYSYDISPGESINVLKKEIIQPELDGTLSKEQLEIGYSNFSIIKFKLLSCDILYLLRSGHLRIKGNFVDKKWDTHLVVA